MVISGSLDIQPCAPIPTWFNIGGNADRKAIVNSIDDLRYALDLDRNLKVLGDGANLLVDDDGVGELVAELKGDFESIKIEPGSNRIFLGAGVKLPRAINSTLAAGLGGLEVLAGFPATMGGCVVMNAGGKYGEISELVTAVHVLNRNGEAIIIPRKEIDFSYRHSGLNDFVITGAELALIRGNAATLKTRMIEIMKYKKDSQPLAANSAGCCFKNPKLERDVLEFQKGQRIGAGMVIDRAGLKGFSVRGASVSTVHANFLVTTAEARAGDVIDLMSQVTQRVYDAFGITLSPEVVIWKRAAR